MAVGAGEGPVECEEGAVITHRIVAESTPGDQASCGLYYISRELAKSGREDVDWGR